MGSIASPSSAIFFLRSFCIRATINVPVLSSSPSSGSTTCTLYWGFVQNVSIQKQHEMQHYDVMQYYRTADNNTKCSNTLPCNTTGQVINACTRVQYDTTIIIPRVLHPKFIACLSISLILSLAHYPYSGVLVLC